MSTSTLQVGVCPDVQVQTRQSLRRWELHVRDLQLACGMHGGDALSQHHPFSQGMLHVHHPECALHVLPGGLAGLVVVC